MDMPVLVIFVLIPVLIIARNIYDVSPAAKRKAREKRVARLAGTSTATKGEHVVQNIVLIVVVGIVFALVVVTGDKYAWHAPKTNDCYNNGITILHGTAYHGSCDPNGPPSTQPDGRQ